ncbi:MAG: hypothetical protein GY943_24535 [Chloroflexi bacterium]|nr:hypothetical protein [Chloroflexota bacterium]
MKTTISLTLNTERDQDIIDWLNSFGSREKSKAIRAALRTHISETAYHDVTLRDIYQAIQALGRSGIQAQDAPVTQSETGSEPDDIANTLDNLGW